VLPKEWKQHDELSGNRMDRVRSILYVVLMKRTVF
jgi:hypothetical protein